VAMRGGLRLEEAQGLTPTERGPKAMEALQDFIEAFTHNRNLIRVWKPTADRAQQIHSAPVALAVQPTR